MTATSDKLATAVAAYCAELQQVYASGGATGERSSYGPLATLLNGVGATLRPKVFCVGELANQGAGHPDFGLYGARQLQRGAPREGQIPERGVVEVKGANDDAWLTATSDQVSRYWERYRLVLVTNLRHFVLVGEDSAGRPSKLESFQLAASAEALWRGLDTPQAFARTAGAGLGEYLARALCHLAALAEPKDLAWLLASYARDGLARVETAGDAPQLAAVRSALEEALGVRFDGEKGVRFFRSTLVQTLFYGIFSAWVLWGRQGGTAEDRFDWRTAVWHLRSPVLAALFQQLAQPGRLQPLDLVEVLDWTAAALERVDRAAFFSRFNTGEAVPYFYEPFLEAFDPALRKDLGVWYTPTAVVRSMVAQVDNALKQDLHIPDGLAAENVVVLDPCCGTGAYLAEVLRRIAANLTGQGLGALAGARVKAAATGRVFGFEIMPAPFVIAHLQVGLTLQELDAPLGETGKERAGVFLTNALTGWEPRTNKPLPFPELEEERDRAEQVKQAQPILVILGNPPYNGFAGMAVAEERDLSNAYRQTRRVRRPEGQGLNDLYVRFFRMAERRIAEKTGQGVICFISNYSWLDGLSFTGMRERFLEVFDAVRIDCLNGDVRKGGKTPDGEPDGSVFTVDGESVGIQVGTAIATLVRKQQHKPTDTIALRQLWGQPETKREELLETAEAAPDTTYKEIQPILPLGLPFIQTEISQDYFEWPSLPELFPKSFPGVQTKRDSFLIDIDLDRLRTRITEYFDVDVSHGELARRYPVAMKDSSGFVVRDARLVRDSLIARGGPTKTGFVRHAYRPFDQRWLYWEPGHGLLGRPVSDYWPHVFEGNLWLSSAQHLRKGAEEPQAYITEHMGSLHLIERGALMFPAWLRDDGITNPNSQARRPNLSIVAQNYLAALSATVEDLFHHVLAVLHDPAYRQANAGALRMGWPRIPLPGWPKGAAENAAALARSAARGRQLAVLLDCEAPVPGVTQAPLRPEMAVIAVPATRDGRNMADEDFVVTAGWGHFGKGDAVMPGQGRVVERPLTPEERSAMAGGHATLPLTGQTTLDIYLNDHAFWRNVPLPVWRYKLGGYQVLKKWLSYREQGVLGRGLRAEEVLHFTDTARRIGGIWGLRSGARWAIN